MQVIHHELVRTGDHTRLVHVLDTHQHAVATRAGRKPCTQHGVHVADMHAPRRRRANRPVTGPPRMKFSTMVAKRLSSSEESQYSEARQPELPSVSFADSFAQRGEPVIVTCLR